MRNQINSYLAVLIITLTGSWVTLVIVRVATSDNIVATANSNALYAELQQSIREQ